MNLADLVTDKKIHCPKVQKRKVVPWRPKLPWAIVDNSCTCVSPKGLGAIDSLLNYEFKILYKQQLSLSDDLIGARAGVRPAGALAADVVVVGIRAGRGAGAAG